MNTGPVDPQFVADKFLRAFNCMAQEGHFELARKNSGLCRVTRVDQLLWDAINYNYEKVRSPLCYAITKSDLVRAEFLLKHCADNVFYDVHDPRAPLQHAVELGNPEMVLLLLKYGAGVNAADNLGWTALMRASQSGNIAVVKVLCSHGASLDMVNLGGTTALIVAAANNHIDVMELLLAHGAKINTVAGGMTALLWAISHGYKNAEKMLRDRGAV
jgi:ankyrin repeat protein